MAALNQYEVELVGATTKSVLELIDAGASVSSIPSDLFAVNVALNAFAQKVYWAQADNRDPKTGTAAHMEAFITELMPRLHDAAQSMFDFEADGTPWVVQSKRRRDAVMAPKEAYRAKLSTPQRQA